MAQRTARPRTRPWPAGALLLLVIALGAALAAVAAEDDSVAEPDAGLDAICRVASLAGAGDTDGARTAFINDAHQPVHELALAADAAGNRAAAARLLEAKQVIESADRGPTTEEANTLVAATVEAARSAGRGAVTCP